MSGVPGVQGSESSRRDTPPLVAHTESRDGLGAPNGTGRVAEGHVDGRTTHVYGETGGSLGSGDLDVSSPSR